MDECWEYIVNARMMAAEDKLRSAFDLYLVAFERNPSLRPAHEAEFRGTLLRLNSVLAEHDKMVVIFDNFGRAIRMFPVNPHLLNDIGKYLYKFGFYKEAVDHFGKALTMNPASVDAEKNLNSVKNLLIERWHYRMLNDNLRNESYRQAIRHSVLSLNDKVIDVGTGTGLLAIYAYEAGASKIIGCDGSELMTDIAETVIHGNNIKNIKVINKMSNDLSLWDLDGKCTVLVTEMFDAGLFGEHVLQMLSHAWPTLLTKEAVVVPNKAEFFVMGVQSQLLGKNYHLSWEAKELLNISRLNVHMDPNDDTYDCEDVNLFKDMKYVTQPQSLLKINFNDLTDIATMLKRSEPYTVRLEAEEDGRVNLVVGWFNLHLSDLVTITTNPRAADKATAWQQAVFFDDIPKCVKKNEIIHLDFLVNGGKLTRVPSTNTPVIRTSTDIIRFLNDSEYMKKIINCVSMASIYLTQLTEMSEITVVDLCPFPIFGLLMLKRGAKSLLCCAANDLDQEFIVTVFLENQVSMSKVSIACGDDWNQDIFGDEKYHVIFSHILEIGGDVNIRLKCIAEHLRHAHLVQGGLFMPAQVSIVTQLVSSHWLDLNNRLYDENISNYAMASLVNKYKVSQNFNVDFSTLKYVSISSSTVLGNYPNGPAQMSKLAMIERDGHANAILCWYNIELIKDTNIISTNRPMSFMNGMLFLTYHREQFTTGNYAKIIQHKDADGCFKIVVDANTVRPLPGHSRQNI